jgi:hypothetical protein
VRLSGHYWLALCLPLAFAASAAVANSQVILEQVRIGLTPGNTRIVFDLNGSPDYELMQLHTPDRLVIEFSSTLLDYDLNQLVWSGTPVKELHSETGGDDILRVTFALGADVETRAFMLEPDEVGGHRLVVDLADGTAARTPQVSSIRFGRHDEYSRFVFDLDATVDYELASFPDQGRVVLKLANARIEPALLELPLEGSPVTSVELQDDSELVFTLAEAVEPRVFTLAPRDKRGHRLVLDLYPVTQPLQPPSATPASASIAVALATSGPGADTSDEKNADTAPGERLPAGEPVAAETSNSRRARAVSFSGTWQQEWAVARHGGNQKFEAVVQPRWDVDFGNGMDLTTIVRLRLDTIGDLGPTVYRPFNYSSVNGPSYNTEHASIELRELYLDVPLGNSFLRLGKQQVVWGESDGIKVLDVVNPQSFREFILQSFDDSRIPLWMVNLELPVGREGSIQLLWIPDTTYYELAERGTPYALTSPLLVPRQPPGLDTVVLEPDTPDDPFGDSDAGIRYRSFVAGWDISLNYFYSYADFPVPFQRLEQGETGLVGVLDPDYKRNHLVGGSANNAFGDFSVRTELVWNSDRWFTSTDIARRGVEESAEISSIVGLDWQHSSSGLLSAQWFYSRVLDYRSAIERDKTEQMVSLLLRQTFDNENWEFTALALHSLDYDDSLFQLKLKYWFSSELEVWLGADIFDGRETGIFGQFDKTDRILMGLQYGF